MKQTNKILAIVLFSLTAFLQQSLYAQQVDEFTGDFRYSVPLLSIPSPEGPGTSVSAHYSAGIGVNQSASEIGLGWGLNAGGAIIRSVSGIPDDWKNITTANSAKGKFLSHTGCMHPGGELDVYNTSYKIYDLHNSDTNKFYFPDYDSYQVAGPNLSGSLSPHLFDFASIQINTNEDYDYEALPDSGFSKKMQFIFTGDYADTLISRHYPTSPINGSTTFRLPSHSFTDGELMNSNVPFIGKRDQGYQRNSNRLVSSKYVEYFTNTQINTYTVIPGTFIDYKATHTRTSTDFDMDGIGAYRITDENGFVYHYSLPVYINYEIHYNYPLNNDYSVQSYTNTSVYTYTNVSGQKDTIIEDMNNGDIVIMHKRDVRYAYQWLLTAITGPDYSDENSNGIVDDDDKGYWMAYDYQLWTDNFSRRTPKYGLNYSFNASTDDAGQNDPVGTAGKISGKYGTASIFNQELFYLNKVRSSSHTGIFVYDLRNDEASDVRLNNDCATEWEDMPEVTPQLKLNKIALFRNEEFSTLPTLTALTSTVTAWDLDNTEASEADIYNQTWYNANTNDIEELSLKTIEFSHEYSLSRKYYNNINTQISATCHLASPSAVHSEISSSDYANSGKLTLTEITSYEQGHEQMQPSVVFDYNKSVSNDNPDYNPKAIDYWGFYKSDVTAEAYSSYTSTTSAVYTDAWSMRKITLPEGGSVEVDYESDYYEKVLKKTGGFEGPARIYGIKNMTVTSTADLSPISVELEDDLSSDFWDWSSNLPGGTLKHAFIPFDIYPNPGQKGICTSTTFTVNPGPKAVGNFTLYTNDPSSSPNDYTVDNTTGWLLSPGDFKYTGNGFLMYQLPAGTSVPGGGIRVKKLTFKNGITDSYKQEYTYNGGVTPTEPDRFDKHKKWKDPSGDLLYTKLNAYEFSKHKMAPGVGYTETTVKNTGQGSTSQGYVTTTFHTSDEGIDNYTANVQRRISTYSITVCGGPGTLVVEKIDTNYVIEVVDKFNSMWGIATEINMKDVNDNIISKTVNEYTNLTQGAIAENYHFRLSVNPTNYCDPPTPYYNKRNIIPIMRRMPLVLSKQTTYNRGMETSTEYVRFDDITGVPIEVRSTEPNKGITVSRSSHAFRIPEYTSMGSMILDSVNNKNILSPFAISKITKDSTITASSDFLSYNVQTFTDDHTLRRFESSIGTYTTVADNNRYWRPHNNYVWAGNSGSLDNYGLYKSSDFTAYTFSVSSQDSKWRFGSENTLIDERGHVLETKGFNNRFVASKYGHENKFTIAQAGNCNYASFTHTSFEDKTDVDPSGTTYFFGGEVKLNPGMGNDAIISGSITAHTGNYYLKVPSSSTLYPTFRAIYNTTLSATDTLMRGRIYRASVWTHTSTPSDAALVAVVSGSTTSGTITDTYSVTAGSTDNVQAGEWKLMNLDIDIPASYVSTGSTNNDFRVYLKPGASGEAYFDDFRVHPVEATITANVYDPVTGRVIATLDNNNFAIKTTYDAAGRIKEVYKEIEGHGFKKIKKYQYTYNRNF